MCNKRSNHCENYRVSDEKLIGKVTDILKIRDWIIDYMILNAWYLYSPEKYMHLCEDNVEKSTFTYI